MSRPSPREPRRDPRRGTHRRWAGASDYVRERAEREAGGSELQRVKDALASRGLSPRKRFGQNFLVREEIAERIVEHAHLREDDVAVEIGPGAGALTLRLARRARHLIAVEKDAGLADYLREECGDVPRISIVEGDFLEFDLAAAAAAHGVAKLVVVGNIPYNVTTPILEHLFASRRVVRSAVLLVQQEYAERLAAAAGTPEYGALTLFARYHALMEPLMTIRAGAFWPRPDVDSMLVRFFLREHPPVEAPEALLFRIIRASFQQRRKQLQNTLENALGLPRAAVERLGRQAGIALTRRGETLTLDEFARLARAAVDRGIDA
jgi:16S rRNA (adenine1518-N6/adenine1519-N6)-dimethyltransferase